MKTWLSVMKTLIPANLLTAILSVLAVLAIREQAQMKAKQQELNQAWLFQQEIPAKTDESQLQQYEQKLKELQAQIEASQKGNPQPTQKKDLQQQAVAPASPRILPQSTPIQPRQSTPVAQPSLPPSPSERSISPRQTVTRPPLPSPSAKPSSQPLSSQSRITSDTSRVKPQREETTVAINQSKEEEKNSSQVQVIPETKKNSLTPKSQPIPAKPNRDQSIQYANDIAAGLITAHQKGQIKYGTSTYRKVQTAINLLRRGKSKESAARQGKVSLSTLEQLIKWGKKRFGSIDITEVNSPPSKLPSQVKENPTDKSIQSLKELPSQARENSRDKSIQYANDIAAGLIVAHQKGQIKYGTSTYRQVQTAINLLRRGESKESAARQGKVSLSILEQLIKWGKNRPGS